GGGGSGGRWGSGSFGRRDGYGPLRPAGGVVASAAVPAATQGTQAPGQRLDTVSRWDHRLRPGTASSAARSPAGVVFSGRTAPVRGRRTAMTPVMALPAAAAVIC